MIMKNYILTGKRNMVNKILIVTRNVSDYATSEVKAIEPRDYLKL